MEDEEVFGVGIEGTNHYVIGYISEGIYRQVPLRRIMGEMFE